MEAIEKSLLPKFFNGGAIIDGYYKHAEVVIDTIIDIKLMYKATTYSVLGLLALRVLEVSLLETKTAVFYQNKIKPFYLAEKYLSEAEQ